MLGQEGHYGLTSLWWTILVTPELDWAFSRSDPAKSHKWSLRFFFFNKDFDLYFYWCRGDKAGGGRMGGVPPEWDFGRVWSQRCYQLSLGWHLQRRSSDSKVTPQNLWGTQANTGMARKGQQVNSLSLAVSTWTLAIQNFCLFWGKVNSWGTWARTGSWLAQPAEPGYSEQSC